MAFTALFDACVLYPAQLRDLLMRLALTDMFRAKWTADIHREWIEAALRERPDLERAKLERARDLMDKHVRDCIVEGYEDLIPSIDLPDPGDRHVVAAAIVGRADVDRDERQPVGGPRLDDRVEVTGRAARTRPTRRHLHEV